MLNYLEGLGDSQELGAKKNKSAKKTAKKTAKQEKKSKKKTSKPTKKKKVAKIAIAPARNAFLLVVSLNALKLGTKLATAYKKDSQRIISFWTNLGGKPEALKKAIEKGSKQTLGENYLGVALEVTLATALPIVVAVSKVLKDLGVTNKKEQTEEATAIEQSKDVLDKDPSTPKGTAELPEGTDSGKVDTGEEKDNTLLYVGGAVVVAGGLYLATKK